MGDAPTKTTYELAVALADIPARAAVAVKLAAHVGVDDLFLFAPDTEIGALLPAPGWPQTVPGLARLRKVLADCASTGHHRRTVDVGDGRGETSLLVLTANGGVMLVLIGGEPRPDYVAELAAVFPLLAAAVRAEITVRVAEGNAASAREASRHAQGLATVIDATRSQLESALRVSAALNDEAERARQRVALLDRVTRELVDDVDDAGAAIQRVANAIVPTLADWCTVYAPRGGDAMELVAVGHSDDTHREQTRVMVERHMDPGSMGGIARVLRTGVTEHVRELTDDVLRASASDERDIEQLRRYAPRSYLAVALKGHQRILGVLALSMTSRRTFTDDDCALAEEIGNRAAQLLEQRRLLEEARAARAEAEQASRAKDEFLAMLGHELRNPLAPISTALALMKLRGEEAMQEERAIIERQIRHVVQLVDDLLDVSRITRGKIELRRDVLCVREIVATAVEMALPLIEERRHHLSVNVDDSLFVTGDARRLAQIFSNLLNNAAKYTPDGGTIALSGLRDGAHMVLRIKDNGIGMDAELVPRVFELFAQAPQTLDRATGGLGLGLAIVRTLVDLHGGSVEARSDGVGTGSEFVVRLAAVAAASASEPVRSSEPPVTLPARRRVLVVDDNEDAAWLLTQLLSVVGHDVQMAVDGPSALLLLERFTPDAALLDIGLPVMNGFDLARHVRSRLPGVFLVAVTGYGQQSDRDASRAAGFDAHLVKPVDIDDVHRLLSQQVLDRTVPAEP